MNGHRTFGFQPQIQIVEPTYTALQESTADSSFYMNGNTLGFQPQTQNAEPTYRT